MLNKFSTNLQLFVRRIIHRFESIFFLAKELLSERNFIYLSCITVSISSALAVIILKSFAHNVFLFANYLNTFLKLPYSNSILPIYLTIVNLKMYNPFTPNLKAGKQI